MTDEFNRQARATQRADQAEKEIAALKDSLKTERTAFTAMQSREATALRHRHKAEDQQLHNAADAKRDFDRVSEVQDRQQLLRSRRVLHAVGTRPFRACSMRSEAVKRAVPNVVVLLTLDLA